MTDQEHTPISRLAELILNDEDGDFLEDVELFRPLLREEDWTALCDATEVCPIHLTHVEICLDDEDDCPTAQAIREARHE